MVKIQFENVVFGPCHREDALNKIAREGWVSEHIPDFPDNVIFKKPNPDPLDREKFIYLKIEEMEEVYMPLSALALVVANHHHHP